MLKLLSMAQALLGAAAPAAAGDPAQAAGVYVAAPVAPDSDFRVYVFTAYGATVILLLLFSLWSVGQTKRAEDRLKHLLERLDRANIK